MSAVLTARNIKAGMHVAIGGTYNTLTEEPWIVLSQHPKPGYWWLHRWVDDTWETTEAHWTTLSQVIS